MQVEFNFNAPDQPRQLRGWGFDEYGKLLPLEKIGTNFEDAGSPGVLRIFSTKGVAREKRNLWVRQCLPMFEMEVRAQQEALRQSRRRLHRYRSLLNMSEYYSVGRKPPQKKGVFDARTLC